MTDGGSPQGRPTLLCGSAGGGKTPPAERIVGKGEQIIDAPTLVKRLPSPLRRIIGDMSEPGRVLVRLGIETKIKDE